MKLWILTASLALVATACASQKQATKPTVEDQLTQLTERVNSLQRENLALKARTGKSQVALDPTIPPPAHRNIGGLPENFGWLHRAPDGCQNSPLSLKITNQSNYHLRIFIDGKEIKVRGAVGLMPGSAVRCIKMPSYGKPSSGTISSAPTIRSALFPIS